jgi:hypothetical protein
MTKRNLLLSLFLVLGLVAMAPSAMASQWIAGANTRATNGRVEGFDEATGQVTLAISNGGPVPSGAYFLIQYNLPIAELASVTVTCTGSNGSGVNGNTTLTSIWKNGCGSSLAAPVLANASTVKIEFANNTPSNLWTFATGDQSEIAVTVRVNATGASPLPFDVFATVTAYTPNPTYQVSLSYVNSSSGLLVLIISGPSLYLSGGPMDVLTCIGVKCVASYSKTLDLLVAEEFQWALTSESAEMLIDPDIGVVYTNSPLSAEWSSNITNGSEFTITFSGVPASMGMAVDTADIAAGNCGVTPTSMGGACANTPTLAVAVISAVSVSAPDAAGYISFEFQVDTIDNSQAESLVIPIKMWSHGPLPPGESPNHITATINFTPNPPTTDRPWFVPTAVSTITNAVNFYDCVTNLLFPFVTNIMAGGGTAWNNLGTSLFISNTTADPFNTTGAVLASPQEVEGAAVPQSGACTFWLFPNLDSTKWDGKAGVVAAYTPAVTVQPGATFGFDMGSVTAFAGQTGYIFAQCGFQNAHGVEMISDNYGLGEPGYAATFEAIVIPTVEFYHRSPAGDGLGETAIAPLAVDKMIQKLLFGGVHNAASTCSGINCVKPALN